MGDCTRCNGASDVIPTIHEETKQKSALDIRPWLLVIGAIVVGVSINLAHKYIDAGDVNHGINNSNTLNNVEEKH